MYSIDRATRRRKNRLTPSLATLEDRQLLSIGWGTPDSITVNSVANVAVQVGHPDTQKLLSATVSGGSQLMAWVDWGDSTSSQISGTLTAGSTTNWNWWNPSPSSFDINGGHNYQKVGLYNAHVYLWDAIYTRREVDFQVDAWDLALEEMQPVGTAKDVVGAPVVFGAILLSGNPGDSILNVAWDITDSLGHDGVITSQTIDTTGFHNDYGRFFSKDTPIGTKISLLEGNYWNGTPGVHTAKMVVKWQEPDPGAFGVWVTRTVPVTRTFDVKAPTATVNLVSSQFADIRTYSNGTYLSSSPNRDTPGMSMYVSIDNPDGSFNGQFGVVQVVTPLVYRWTRDKVTGVRHTYQYGAGTGVIPGSTWPLLDVSATDTTPYYDITTRFATDGSPILQSLWDVGQTADLGDSPKSQWTSLGRSLEEIFRLQRQDVFTDTVMFVSTGGVAVPIGPSFGWKWGGVISTDPDAATLGTPTVDASITPVEITPVNSNNPSFPTWGETAYLTLDTPTEVPYLNF